MGGVDLDRFVQGYLRTALWSSVDDDGEPLDWRFDILDLSQEAKDAARSVCKDFIRGNTALETALDSRESYDSCSAGADFWLTRNGHGAGFWDRGLGAVGDELTKIAKVYGEVSLVPCSEGKLYFE